MLTVFPIFVPKSGCSPKKKGLHFHLLSVFPIFVPKSGCSLKKKKTSSLRIDLLFPYFSHKIMVVSKKKRFSLRIELRFIYFCRQLQVSSQNVNFFRDPKIILGDPWFEKLCTKASNVNLKHFLLLKNKLFEKIFKNKTMMNFYNCNNNLWTRYISLKIVTYCDKIPQVKFEFKFIYLDQLDADF